MEKISWRMHFSPASISFAIATSSSRLRRGILPISWRYMRTGSEVSPVTGSPAVTTLSPQLSSSCFTVSGAAVSSSSMLVESPSSRTSTVSISISSRMDMMVSISRAGFSPFDVEAAGVTAWAFISMDFSGCCAAVCGDVCWRACETVAIFLFFFFSIRRFSPLYMNSIKTRQDAVLPSSQRLEKARERIGYSGRTASLIQKNL